LRVMLSIQEFCLADLLSPKNCFPRCIFQLNNRTPANPHFSNKK